MTSECVNVKNKKQVIIIGNGPSAITLSYILAGNWPYYNATHPHPNDQLHHKLIHPPPPADSTIASSTSQVSSLTSPSSGRMKHPCGSSSAICITDHEQVSTDDDDDDDDNDEDDCEDDEDDSNSRVQGDNLPSILNYDLQYLSHGLEGRSINPVSVLMDTLQFPNADFGSNRPSCLEWKFDAANAIDHLVIGQGNPGGSWNSMIKCDETYTVSFSQWMQLPNLSINATKYGHKCVSTATEDNQVNLQITQDTCMETGDSGKLCHLKCSCETIDQSTSGERVSLANVAKYFKYYVATQQLSKYFVNNAIVTAVKYIDKHQLWHVSGWQKNHGLFSYLTENIVLATGNNDLPNRLKVRGEGYSFVIHSIEQMDKILTDAKNCNLHDAVLIVGSGLSAADAIITCKQHKIPVKHVFRRHPDDPALIFNQLPENMYPEYHSVHEAMKRSFYSSCSNSNCTNSTGSSDYTPFPMHSVAEIRKNKEVILTNLLKPDDCSTLPCRTTVKVSYVLALIGRRPELSFIKPKELRAQLPMFPGEAINSRSNPLRIHPYTHECISRSNLYAMGPLVGDNFVRFVQGAALAIARDMILKTSTCTSQINSGELSERTNDQEHQQHQHQQQQHSSDKDALCVI